MLNIPGTAKTTETSRGKVLKEYIMTDISADKFIEDINDYSQNCNQFILVSVTFDGNLTPVIQTYNNVTNRLDTWNEKYVGFSNTVPGTCLTKVKGGLKMFQNVCERFSKEEQRDQLTEELFNILKCREKHLPDEVLELAKPDSYELFSSIFVAIPKIRYGTRTHTLLLVTKSGHVNIIESTMEPPIDTSKPNWIKTNYECKL
ncbi:transport and Golgi organization protein 2 [Leptidea sinapis]|uniref:transport and Golgi organization protein 2 n=1 Tax=Leptidea sinapis TaxID=189913 RepID=UPI0021C3307D|nr:transport and Golgi organization protein 2 [Leptidea sinapis]